MKEKPLSDKIYNMYSEEVVETKHVREFIEKVKEMVYDFYNGKGTMESLREEIDKLAGEKLVSPSCEDEIRQQEFDDGFRVGMYEQELKSEDKK